MPFSPFLCLKAVDGMEVMERLEALGGAGYDQRLDSFKQGDSMASSDNQQDMTAHDQTYGGVIGMLKWGAAGVAIVVIAVVMIIAR
jgi:Bacterial aa3 type cytochrome c oxidase subunit IV